MKLLTKIFLVLLFIMILSLIFLSFKQNQKVFISSDSTNLTDTNVQESQNNPIITGYIDWGEQKSDEDCQSETKCNELLCATLSCVNPLQFIAYNVNIIKIIYNRIPYSINT